MAGELFDREGNRKYLSAEERLAFLRAADRAPRELRTFCALLHYSGCRISEALDLTYDRIDLAGGVIVFESLKKRREGVYRAVPVPPSLLDALDLVHNVREQQKARGRGSGIKLWSWERTTAWRHVKAMRKPAWATARRSRPKVYGTALGWRRSLPASRSTWCRSGWAMRSFPPPPFMPMRWEPRRRT